jgi:hypothetical protein
MLSSAKRVGDNSTRSPAYHSVQRGEPGRQISSAPFLEFS